MFIKKLTISSKSEIIRDISFTNGMNLIIDNTPIIDKKLTGNNVGKTTVLKLISFALGGNDKEIYTDDENKKSIYTEIKKFLIDNCILIKLILVDNLDNIQKEIVIERNFLNGSNAITKINGEKIHKKDFEEKLLSLIFNKHQGKPSFRQLISHNIRYKDDSINNTLKTLNRYSTDVEYETLYLYLLGCRFNDGERKQSIVTKIQQEKIYKDRLEKNQTKNSYEIALALLDEEIAQLDRKKTTLNLNEKFEEDLERLNRIKYLINKSSSNITKLSIRRDLIIEAKNDMEKDISNIDLDELELIYKESKQYLPNINKTFNELVAYHNKMIYEKINFITKELPTLDDKIASEQKNMRDFLVQEKELSISISKSNSFEELEQIILNLNEKYRLKGEYENTISRILEVETSIEKLEKELSNIDDYLYSSEFEDKLKSQLSKFNRLFSKISNELYGEKYALKFEKEINKKTNKFIYKFNAFNLNMSSGKKQGEILCFDLAYILFANEERIPSLQFLLNDKKELLHGNQLYKVADFVSKNKIQLIISILKDKLPEELIKKSNIALELSQDEKLFKLK
ncbi:DUF2326 domain-containing protein [Mannheimia varigena]|uniref:DUF2326 domain-containing protein n=1 Tax=Mannheimia varigena TaxID=85404 RepID=UPI0015B6FBF3|nr:DUF2326 domain-containing protein [Mannheimia varigena]QLD33896.1 DUF2326 domain-containing protein [Mannheimia varigena]